MANVSQSRPFTRRVFGRLGALAASATLLATSAACGGGGSASTGSGSDGGAEYKIGVVFQMTGAGSVYAEAAQAGTKAAVEDVNKRNVAGRKISIEIADSGSDVQTTTTTCTRLVQQVQVQALAVFIPGPQLIACNAVAKANNIPLVSESAGAGNICAPNLVSIGLVPNQQSLPMIAYLIAQGKKSWYFFGSDYSTPKKAFSIAKPYVGQKGGTAVGESYEPLGTSDFSQDIAKIVAARPDAVFINVIGNDDVAFEKQWAADPRTNGITRVDVLLSEGASKGLGAAADGIWAAAAYFSAITGAGNDDFKAKVKAAGYTGYPDVTSYLSYMQIEMVAAAVKQAGTASQDVTNALNKASMDGPVGTLAVKNAFSFQPVYLAQSNADGTFTIKQKSDPIDPQLDCAPTS